MSRMSSVTRHVSPMSSVARHVPHVKNAMCHASCAMCQECQVSCATSHMSRMSSATRHVRCFGVWPTGQHVNMSSGQLCSSDGVFTTVDTLGISAPTQAIPKQYDLVAGYLRVHYNPLNIPVNNSNSTGHQKLNSSLTTSNINLIRASS